MISVKMMFDQKNFSTQGMENETKEEEEEEREEEEGEEGEEEKESWISSGVQQTPG